MRYIHIRRDQDISFQVVMLEKAPKSLSLFFFLFVIFKLVAMFSPTFSLSHQLPSLKRLGQLSTHESFFGGERE